MPEEYRPFQCRVPTGRGDDMPACFPPIFSELTPERQARFRAGRGIGHRTSRMPLLSTTAEQDGSFPDTFSRSTAPMFPAPMPHALANPRPEQNENADASVIERPFLTDEASYTEYARRLHQDRGNYLNQQNANDQGWPETTFRPPPMGWSVRVLPTNNAQIDVRHGGGPAERHQANIGLIGAEWADRSRKGGEFVNNRGSQPLNALTNTRTGLGSYEGRLIERDCGGEIRAACGDNLISQDRISLFPYRLQVSGDPVGLTPTLFTYDANNVDAGAVRPKCKMFGDVQASGGARTAVDGPYRYDRGGLLDNHPTDAKDVYHGVSFGYDASDHCFAADRFQKVRTQLFDARPEERSSVSMVNAKGNPRYLVPRPIVAGCREYRVADRDPADGHVQHLDEGLLQETTQANPMLFNEASFYSHQQARQNLF